MPFSMQTSLKGNGHVLTTKFEIFGKSDCLVSQTGTSSFYSCKMVNILKSNTTLYISLVGPYRHVFRVMHVFLRQFGSISLTKQTSALKDEMINSN
jgi:hypothetical protein